MVKFFNPTGLAPRAIDSYGSGAFGAPRTRNGVDHPHFGVDVESSVDSPVWSPIYGFIARYKNPYGDKSDCDHGVLILGTGDCAGYAVTLYYVFVPKEKIGSSVAAGDFIGVACNLGSKYPVDEKHPLGIINHVHVEVVKDGERIDPGPLLFGSLVSPDANA